MNLLPVRCATFVCRTGIVAVWDYRADAGGVPTVHLGRYFESTAHGYAWAFEVHGTPLPPAWRSDCRKLLSPRGKAALRAVEDGEAAERELARVCEVARNQPWDADAPAAEPPQ